MAIFCQSGTNLDNFEHFLLHLKNSSYFRPQPTSRNENLAQPGYYENSTYLSSTYIISATFTSPGGAATCWVSGLKLSTSFSQTVCGRECGRECVRERFPLVAYYMCVAKLKTLLRRVNSKYCVFSWYRKKAQPLDITYACAVQHKSSGKPNIHSTIRAMQW